MKTKPKFLYIGMDNDGILEVSGKPLIWFTDHKWWSQQVSKNGDGGCSMHGTVAAAFKIVMNLTIWPFRGQVLIYDLTLEEGEILHHSDPSIEKS